MVKYEPSCCIRRLRYPKHHSEEQLRYRLCQKIESAGYYTALEVPIEGGYLDIVVFDRSGTTAYAIVETKAREGDEHDVEKCRIAYARFGIPVFVICGISEMNHFIATHLRNLADEYRQRYASAAWSVHPEVASMIRRLKARNARRRTQRKIGRYIDPDLRVIA